MGERVEIVEVSPRDGLQNEATLLSVADKAALIRRAYAAGLRRIEAASFVNPQKVPQMAGAEETLAAVAELPREALSSLALNVRGVERALAAGAAEINYVVVATDAFAIRNNGADAATLIARWPEAAAAARAGGARLALTVSTAFGCPFEGETPPARVAALAEAASAHPPDEFILADTIGVAVPRQVRALFATCGEILGPGVRLRAHFHNTRNTAVANALAAYEAGVTVLDASIAGIGGCPFAPGAAGNVATEDLIYLFERSGVSTGVDLDGVIETAHWITGLLGKTPAGLVSRAGGFPHSADKTA